MDFEYSRQFPAGVEPLVNLPWFKYRQDQPPEGIQNINAFAFDMYNVGRTLHAIVARVSEDSSSQSPWTYQGLGRETQSAIPAGSVAA